MQITAELREEFVQKYEHDKGVMVEASEKMLDEKLNEETPRNLQKIEKNLLKSKVPVAMREKRRSLKNFVVAQLGKEETELHEDQKAMASKFGKLEEFVEALTKEIAEFLAKTKKIWQKRRLD